MVQAVEIFVEMWWQGGGWLVTDSVFLCVDLGYTRNREMMFEVLENQKLHIYKLYTMKKKGEVFRKINKIFYAFWSLKTK